MRIDVITIFPGMFAPILNESMMKRAQDKNKVKINIHDLREFTLDKHQKVDDRPFGGGSGMVIAAQPVFDAVRKIKSQGKKNAKVVLLCPQGKTFTQATAKRLAKEKHLIFICGHYEGIDERVRESLADEEVSIGDYVLTGGELPAMVVVDAVVRLLPGVLGDKNSLNFESFECNLLEYPQYTRPAIFRGKKVPEVLLCGDHKKIASWRKAEALKRTKARRPDLLTEKKKRS
jgi:tRNA (guanine37-N1)-methyltransferase